MMKTALLTGFSLAIAATTTAWAEPVEIYLIDKLDNKQNGYCLDIAKGRERDANPDDGLQGHTCYSPGGALGYDQTFESDRFADGKLHMPTFDVCVVAPSVTAGSALELTACDDVAKQNFVFSGEGTITPQSAPDMCFTVAEATRSGRSDANQIKVLSLEPCDEALAAYQTWGIRTAE